MIKKILLIAFFSLACTSCKFEEEANVHYEKAEPIEVDLDEGGVRLIMRGDISEEAMMKKFEDALKEHEDKKKQPAANPVTK